MILAVTVESSEVYKDLATIRLTYLIIILVICIIVVAIGNLIHGILNETSKLVKDASMLLEAIKKFSI